MDRKYSKYIKKALIHKLRQKTNTYVMKLNFCGSPEKNTIDSLSLSPCNDILIHIFQPHHNNKDYETLEEFA